MSCNEGYKGKCCCNCKCQISLKKHPWNKDPYKGPISEETGLYSCVAEFVIDGLNTAIISDSKHGFCELWKERGN